MSSKLYGDWSKVSKMFNNLDTDLKKSSTQYMEDKSHEVQQAIKDSINNQTGNWEALKPNTVAKKGSTTILKDTGELVDSIEVIKQDEDTYLVVPQGTHSSGLTNSELAIIHEYGTDKIPPRPFIEPIHAKYKGQVQQGMVKIVKETINKY